jgi:endonuclease/exonuclease/phosphatase family metal-dependent hydrolase
MKPSIFSQFSIVSLFSPVIIIINILFLFFWIAKLKKQFLLSLIVLIIGMDSLRSFVNFSDNSKFMGDSKISIISYNVRLFNIYKWIKDDKITLKIRDFLQEKSPDIICLQEYQNFEFELDDYPYVYEKLRGNNLRYGQAIFSKHPIVSKGSVNFNSLSNNAIFADIKIQNDTVRIYNIHLQSFSFEKSNEMIEINQNNVKVIDDISNTFIKQQQQVEMLVNSITKSPYKVIISGDLNNTAFSYVYKQLSNDFNDAFKQKGNGFGITFNYNYVPLRIDFILTQKLFKINKFQTFKLNLSDHEPIYSEISY